MSRMNFYKLRHTGKALDCPKAKPITGCNTNIKRQPVHTFTDAEKVAWLLATERKA